MTLTENTAVFVDRIDPRRIGRGILVSLLTFGAIGTITAVWSNPFFTRMTPIGMWELPSLVAVSLLTGVFTTVRLPNCSTGKAGLGGLASFLGIACPTCNKILMLIFGGEALLRWYDPIRPAVTAIGIVLLCLAIRKEWRKRPVPTPPEFTPRVV